jgi:hypothetical protein
LGVRSGLEDEANGWFGRVPAGFDVAIRGQRSFGAAAEGRASAAEVDAAAVGETTAAVDSGDEGKLAGA